MEKELLQYLITLSKIEDIIHNSQDIQDNTFLNKIIDIREHSITNILNYDLIKLIINIHNKDDSNLPNKNIIQKKSTEGNEDEDSLKNQISDLSNMLGGEQNTDINNFDQNVFDTFGKGLSSLFNTQPIQDPVQIKQIKNENNKNNKDNQDSNITFQIKKK
jgi:hypothetical protein